MRSRIRAILLGRLLGVVLGLVVALAVAHLVIPRPAAADGSFDSRLFADTNADGCGTHALSAGLAAIAQQRAESIADSGNFVNVIEPGVGAENIGWSSELTDPAAAADYVNQAYLNSPEHKANICDRRWGALGIGSVFRSTWNGHSNVWVDAEEFGVGGSAAPPPPAARPAPPRPHIVAPRVPVPAISAPSVPSTGGAG